MEQLDENKKGDWVIMQMYIKLVSKFESLENYSVQQAKARAEELLKKKMEHTSCAQGDPDCHKCKEIKAYLRQHFGESVV